ncbi:uncharacterized protein [Branchiostoma lanceolatum]|uniref:uncharacterized protein n=1 Tax=Branchiostoma lanceolatum TaxID=7740 RepID=UPI0034530AB8
MHRPLSRTVEDFSSLISVAKSRFPSASIIISSILPRFDSEFLNERRFQLNSLLVHLCSRQGVLFFDNGNQAHRAMFAIDGLHLSWKGNVTFADYLSSRLSYAVQLHRQRCQTPHRFALREEVWPELEDGGRSVKDGEETAAVDQEKKRMEAAVDQEEKRMETAAVDQEKKRMETAVDQEEKRMETAAVDQEKKRMETAAVDQEKKRMEGMGQRLGQWARVVRDGRKQQLKASPRTG